MSFRRHFEPGWEVRRLTVTRGQAGGAVKSWGTVETIEGMMRPLSGDKRVMADKETFYSTHKFYCQPTEIKTGDRLRKDGMEYQVKFAQDVNNLGRLMQVDTVVIT